MTEQRRLTHSTGPAVKISAGFLDSLTCETVQAAIANLTRKTVWRYQGSRGAFFISAGVLESGSAYYAKCETFA